MQGPPTNHDEHPEGYRAMDDHTATHLQRGLLSTGIEGLDSILSGGLPAGQLHLVEGEPGTGKTTLALQFLLAGARLGEPVLYVTLSETRRELTMVAASHGWELTGIHVHELELTEESLASEGQLTFFHPSELELSELTDRVLRRIDALAPTRVVFDSLSEMRLLAQGSLRYRRQVLGLKQVLAGRRATVLLLDDLTAPGEDLQLRSIAHGVISLEQLATEYGAERRRLRVYKMRGVSYRGGLHDFAIRRGGIEVFQRLVAADHHADFPERDLSSGVPELDLLLGGGLAAGSSTLLMGPPGSGKSSVGVQFAVAAATRGERSALFLFDETRHMLQTRCRNIGVPLEPHVESGAITIQQVDPAELSPGEFATIVRRAVEGEDGHAPAQIVLLDSLNGYLNSMAEEKQLTSQLHELFKFTNQKGVAAIVTMAQSGLAGMSMRSPVDATYLADNVVLFRYFETVGRLRRTISVIKKRSGEHETTLREITTSAAGIQIGEPLKDLHGVLTGVPALVRADSPHPLALVQE